jgi:hypothetical protein
MSYWHDHMWSSGFTAGVAIMGLTFGLYLLLRTTMGRITILRSTRDRLRIVGRGAFWRWDA